MLVYCPAHLIRDYVIPCFRVIFLLVVVAFYGGCRSEQRPGPVPPLRSPGQQCCRSLAVQLVPIDTAIGATPITASSESLKWAAIHKPIWTNVPRSMTQQYPETAHSAPGYRLFARVSEHSKARMVARTMWACPWWRRMDSDHRSRKATDLQSAPFDRSGTPPNKNIQLDASNWSWQ